jgi:hypothetical protein
LAYDRRIGQEPWAWLAPIPDEELERDWARVTSRMTLSVEATASADKQRVGDLVVYCGGGSGTIVGVGEVVDEPREIPDRPAQWRVRVLPHLILDRSRAPSVALAGMQPPRPHRRLESDEYLRLRGMILSAAVVLEVEPASTSVQPPMQAAGTDPGSPAGMETQSEAMGSEPSAWLAAIPDEQLDRDLERVMSRVVLSLPAALLPSLQRVGDLVVYCGARTGTLAGVGEVVAEPQDTPDGPAQWRLRVLPRLLLDRARAPSLGQAELEPPRLPRHLDVGPYARLRELMLSAAVALGREAAPTARRQH